MSNITKKLLIFASQIFISGCNTTGLIVRDGEKIMYPFTWITILIIFIIAAVILRVIRYFTKNTK